MKQLKIIAQNTVMQNSDSLHGYFGWPTVARLGDGRLAAVASGYRRTHVCPFGKAVISYSEDGGKTWSAPAPIIDTPLDDRDAGILPFGENSVIVTSFNNSVEFQRTWLGWRKNNLADMPEGLAKEREKADIAYCLAYLDLLELSCGEESGVGDSGYRAGGLPKDHEEYYGSTFRLSHDGTRSFGPVHYSPVTSPHGPLVTKDGRLLYVGTPMADIVRKAADPRLRLCEIFPSGRVEEISVIPAPEAKEGVKLSYVEPHAIELQDGGILVHIRTEGTVDGKRLFTVYQTVSRDGGKTFPVPTPVPVNPETAEGVDLDTVGAPPHILRHSSGALISTVGVRTAPFGVRALISRDEGESWDLYSLIPKAANLDLGYPATAELPDGTLYTVYYEHTDPNRPATIEGVHWEMP
jgi:hypothetical protein